MFGSEHEGSFLFQNLKLNYQYITHMNGLEIRHFSPYDMPRDVQPRRLAVLEVIQPVFPAS